MTFMGESGRVRPVVNVRYHREDGTYWADAGQWSGAADTLPELRVLAREGAEFMFGGEYRSRCFFEWTDGTLNVDPVANEEFWPL